VAINAAISTILFVGFTFLYFTIIDSIGVVEGLEEKKARAMIVVGLACVILSMVTNHFMSKFVSADNIYGILGAFLFGSLANVIAEMFLKGKVPKWGLLCIAAAAGAVGFWLMKKWERYLVSWTTAIIGVIFVAHGVGEYLQGSFPFFQQQSGLEDFDDIEFNTTTIIYLVSMVIFAIIGANVQLR